MSPFEPVRSFEDEKETFDVKIHHAWLSGVIAAAFLGPPAATAAENRNSALSTLACLYRIDQAETRWRLPRSLLQAIARVETGRDGSPNPWALNIAGEPVQAATPQDALGILARHPGASIDIGCLQINTRWHADRIPSPEALLDPAFNADYAGRYLAELHGRFGSWIAAIPAYHAGQPNDRGYLCRVWGAWTSIRLERREGMTPPLPQCLTKQAKQEQ